MFRAVKKLFFVIVIGSILAGDTTFIGKPPENGFVDGIMKTTGKIMGTYKEPEVIKGLSSSPKKSTKGQKKDAEVVRVKDGDTYVIKIDMVDETVRLIGVDTPESVHSDPNRNTEWGKKISKIVKKKLKSGTKITLKYDEDKTDRYSRTLAYVYAKIDGKKQMINKWLVKKGYARAAYYAPNGMYKEAFEKLEAEAKADGRGFWADGYEVAFPS